MKQRHVNTTIQFQKMHVPSVHYMIMFQLNYKLLSSLNFTFVNLFTKQELVAGIISCGIFVPHGVFRCGLFLLHSEVPMLVIPATAGEIYNYCLF